MRALDRKLVRDLWQMRGQVLAICLVMASGVAVFVMALSALHSLERTLQTYYDRYRFAEVFGQLKRAPNAVASRIAEIPGVASVQTRIVRDVNLDVADMAEPAIGRLISIPERPTPGLNELHLRAGRYIEPGRPGEVLVSEAFALAHRLHPGDRVTAILNGRKQTLAIVGVALSPEYVYQIRPGDILPDARRFGIFWMGYQPLAAAFNMEGTFNDVSLTLMPGASEPEVLRRLDQLIEQYGGLGSHGRNDQLSHKFITNEIRELRGMAMITPIIFLSVAAFLLNVVMGRLIRTQREQIAAIKAFGYSGREIGMHYLKLVLAIVLVGDAIGTITGAWLGRELTVMYTRFFSFPVFLYALPLRVVVLGLLVSGGACIVGTLGAVRHAVLLPPAEAMRPEPPATFRPTVVERLGLQRLFSPAVRMVLRQLERRPVKSALSSLGIAMAVAILVVGLFMEDAINFVMDSQFYLAQRQDVTLTFIEPTTASVLDEVTGLPGVRFAEPFRGVAVRLRAGPREQRVGIVAQPPGSRLNRLLDLSRREVAVPPGGLIVSAKLAEMLAVKPGDVVTVEVMEGRRPTHEVPIVGLVEDFAGTTAYMDLDALGRLMQEENVISGAYLAVDADKLNALYARLKEIPRAAGVAVKLAALESFRSTIAENLLRMRFFNVLFASVIAFGVVYNSARIALAERSRELATLRVIGFTRGEISAIFLGEQAVLTLVAMPLGLILGYGFAALTTLAYDTELFRIPLIVNRSTYGFAAGVVLIASLLSGLLVRRQLDRLDLVSVLKAKE